MMSKLILIFLFSISIPALACSELGKVEFELPAKAKEACEKTAKVFANSIAKDRTSVEKGEWVPLGPFKQDKVSVFEATKENKARSIGMSVALRSKNNWDCLYCVKMRVDEKDQCTFTGVELHHCAK